MTKFNVRAFLTKRFYEGDGEGGQPEKKFSQADVDRIVQERLAKSTKEAEAAKAQAAESLARLQELHGKFEEGSKEKDTLLKEIEVVKQRAFSAEELKTQEVEAARKEAEATTNALKQQSDFWKKKHIQATVESQISSALSAAGVKPTLAPLVAAHLKTSASINEVQKGEDVEIALDISVPSTKDGKPVTLKLSPQAALEFYRSNNVFPEAFTPRTVSGGGASGGTGSTGPASADEIIQARLERANARMGRQP